MLIIFTISKVILLSLFWLLFLVCVYSLFDYSPGSILWLSSLFGALKGSSLWISTCCCSVAKLCLTLCDPMNIQLPCPSLFLWILLKLISSESVIPSDHLTLCYLLLFLSIFPSIKILSKESALHIRPKYWSYLFSVSGRFLIAKPSKWRAMYHLPSSTSDKLCGFNHINLICKSNLTLPTSPWLLWILNEMILVTLNTTAVAQCVGAIICLWVWHYKWA